ncbi:MAG: nucleoid-structuring protein H-NS [Planctomycetes bacterium]|nr:nucleoid-structuring protein H-NS [Planctomycetota bacterium]
MYRPEIKVLDCTIRDGGLMNNWQFEDDFVRAIFKANCAAGVDYMEIGYKSSESAFSRDENGPWKFCHDTDIVRVLGEDCAEQGIKLAAMADIGRIEYDDIPPKNESVITLIRVACYVHQIDKAIAMVEHCIDKGYETTINLMAVSRAMERDLDEALDDVANSRVPVFYLVDSFGAMYCEQVQRLAEKYIAALPGKTIGYHGHNNQQLAFANTIEAIIRNCNWVDGSMYGIGRGAGNCPLELLMSFLKNPKFDPRPIYETVQKELLPLRQTIDWGYHVPYLITGMLNEHPRSAMKYMAENKDGDIAAFYNYLADGAILD